MPHAAGGGHARRGRGGHDRPGELEGNVLLRDRYRDAVDGKFGGGPDRSVITGGFSDAIGGQRAAAGAARPVLVEDLSRWSATGVELPARLGGQPGRQL